MPGSACWKRMTEGRPTPPIMGAMDKESLWKGGLPVPCQAPAGASLRTDRLAPTDQDSHLQNFGPLVSLLPTTGPESADIRRGGYMRQAGMCAASGFFSTWANSWLNLGATWPCLIYKPQVPVHGPLGIHPPPESA